VENSKIEWCHHTFNPWMGCQPVSPGCINCYAEALMDHRYGKVQWGPHGKRKRTAEAYWKHQYRWAKKAGESGTRARVFCASLADVFDKKAPEGARPDLFRLIRATPKLDWLLLIHCENAAGRLGRWLPQRMARHHCRGRGALPHALADPVAHSGRRSLRQLRAGNCAARVGRYRRGRLPARLDHLRWRVWHGCTPHEASMGPDRARWMR
jgi:Protein of unknown function (DUF5131)